MYNGNMKNLTKFVNITLLLVAAYFAVPVTDEKISLDFFRFYVIMVA